MLPVLPLLVGGAIGTVIGFAAKEYFDEDKNKLDKNFENNLLDIEEWLDEKLVVLDSYKDSLNIDDEDFSSNEAELSLQKLSEMKKKIYYDSFSDFIVFYEKLENADLGKLEFKEIKFLTLVFDKEIYKQNIQQNIQVTTDLLFKANNILNDMVINLNEIIKDSFDYKKFTIKQKELIKEGFLLAKFIQKVCINDDVSENVVLKFNNIISNIEE